MSTLRDVARRSGVSPATVSNVLNNRHTRMSGETRQRILNAIRELNYRPGAVPGVGNSQTARTIGIFLWLGDVAPLSTNPYALTILDGILTVTLAGQWNVTLISVRNWEDARSQVRAYADGRCDGFLLISPPQGIAIPDALRERDYPFVTIGGGIHDPDADSVNIDNIEAVRDLTSYLILQGHTRIAYLIGDEDIEDVADRVSGYCLALSAARLPYEEGWILRPGTYDIPRSGEFVNRFVDQIQKLAPSRRPTALVCGNDQMAHNAWRILTSRGVRIPEDLSLIGFDDTRFSIMTDPPLTTVRQPLFDLGKRGAEILLQRLRSYHAETQVATLNIGIKETLAHEIVIRSSVRSICAP